MKKILLIVSLLLVGCDNSNTPFKGSESYELDVMQIGKVQDLDVFDDTLFVATKYQGIYIYEIIYDNQGVYDSLQVLYENQEWAVDKDIERIYYSNTDQLLFAIDYNNNTYLGYTKFLLNDEEDYDNLIINECGPDANARRFFINTSNVVNPEIYVLYKCFESSSQCVENPHSYVSSTTFLPIFGETLYEDFSVFGDFSVSTNCGEYVVDDLNVDTNDMYFNNDQFFIANSNESINSFEIYEKNGELVDSYEVDSEVRSIYSINNYVLAGTENGCYITLLEGDGISDDEDSKLLIAEGSTIYDIYFNEGELILSTGIGGIIVYDWDGNSMDVNESLRIYSSHAYTARIINNVYFVATRNGLEIYNIKE